MKKLFLLWVLFLQSALGKDLSSEIEEYYNQHPILEKYKDFYQLSDKEQDKISHDFLNNLYYWKKEKYTDNDNKIAIREIRNGINKKAIKKVFLKAKKCDADALLQMGYLNFSESYERSSNNLDGNFSYEMAKTFLELSAEQGHPLAENRLGEMYLLGTGVQQDLNQARQYFYLGYIHGHFWSDLMISFMAINNEEAPSLPFGRMGLDGRMYRYILNVIKKMKPEEIKEKHVCAFFIRKPYINNRIESCRKINYEIKRERIVKKTQKNKKTCKLPDWKPFD